MKLLSEPTSNPKISKNIKKAGILTAPLHLAPFDVSGFQVCPKASEGCAAACLNTSGRGKFDTVQQARIRKTLMYFNNRLEFLDTLVADIKSLERRAIKQGLECGVRLNATSDVPWEKHRAVLMDAFPNVQFYDYTKQANRFKKELPPNYHLTFSLSENNMEEAKEVAELGGNIAVVFRTKEFPSTFLNLPVINGDEHDYRPADPKGCIVGLVAKGDAKKDTSGFVQGTNTDTKKDQYEE